MKKQDIIIIKYSRDSMHWETEQGTVEQFIKWIHRLFHMNEINKIDEILEKHNDIVAVEILDADTHCIDLPYVLDISFVNSDNEEVDYIHYEEGGIFEDDIDENISVEGEAVEHSHKENCYTIDDCCSDENISGDEVF